MHQIFVRIGKLYMVASLGTLLHLVSYWRPTIGPPSIVGLLRFLVSEVTRLICALIRPQGPVIGSSIQAYTKYDRVPSQFTAHITTRDQAVDYWIPPIFSVSQYYGTDHDSYYASRRVQLQYRNRAILADAQSYTVWDGDACLIATPQRTRNAHYYYNDNVVIIIIIILWT